MGLLCQTYLLLNLSLYFRMDDAATAGLLCESVDKSGGLDASRRIAMCHIETFVQTFSDPESLSAASASWAPTSLKQVAEAARIHEAGHLRCRYSFGRQ